MNGETVQQAIDETEAMLRDGSTLQEAVGRVLRNQLQLLCILGEAAGRYQEYEEGEWMPEGNYKGGQNQRATQARPRTPPAGQGVRLIER